ncbi:hypothetical protein ASB58_08990 [Pseudomonas abyssi]|uniref:Uncharacterized protein n=1 Tax=Pseudomonas abyssi TaxID=170540 RepID=A0A395R517_9PSED|nr:hypothetical protein ASB58_08990 [Halopseudomonas gallaeciensis]
MSLLGLFWFWKESVFRNIKFIDYLQSSLHNESMIAVSSATPVRLVIVSYTFDQKFDISFIEFANMRLYKL